jgi:hypothetical protein
MVRGFLHVFRLRFDPEPDVCPTAAILPDELTWPRTIRRAFSDVTATHESTGIHGRGTEEVKTNDVTGRLGLGEVGITVELGRPGIGVWFSDVQRVTMALATVPARFEEKNPVTQLMTSDASGRLDPDIMGEKVMSCIIEVAMDENDFPEVLECLRGVSSEIATIMALGVSVRCDEDGQTDIERVLLEGEYDVAWAKTNVGLGRADVAVSPEAMGARA